jgi:cysteinyl-tRNA synthetase
LVGARVEVGEEKEDPRDFALWKAAPDAEVAWPSPWGKGRPGWHIECSAMSTSCLGETFDIHGGGPDLPFPHHENEIAQSEAATGKKYVNYWMHAGAVRVDNEKMSKSLGNFFTIREVLKKYHPEVVRFFLLSSHYRSPINYSEESLVEARNGLERFYTALRPYADVAALHWDKLEPTLWYKRFVEAMDDDFNSREALAVMYDLVRELNAAAKADDPSGSKLASVLKGLGEIMGLLQRNPNDYFKWSPTQLTPEAGKTSIAGHDVTVLPEAKIEELIAERTQAKLAKNYARADEIRNYLQVQGILLEDSREGTQWRRS